MDIKELSSYGLTSTIFQVIENGFTFDEETGEVFFTQDDLEALQEALDVKFNNMQIDYKGNFYQVSKKHPI